MKVGRFRQVMFAVALLCAGFQGSGQIISYPLNSEKIDYTVDGFIYALPATTIRLDITVSKTEKFKGKFSDYAVKLLGITEMIAKDAVTYDISDVKISTITDVDTAQLYFAQFPKKADADREFFVELSEKGFISAFKQVDKEAYKRDNKSVVVTPFRDLLKPVLIERVDTIIRRVSIDTTIIEEKVLKRSISEKSNEQQAREIADLIYRIEDNKFSLITGYQEVNYSKESLQFMLDNLNRMEQEYLAYFKGTTVKSQETYTFYYKPMAKPAESFNTFFRFSPGDGIYDKNARSGEAVSITVTPSNTYKTARAFESERMQIKRKNKGLYYRIAEPVVVKVKMGNTVLASENTYVGQMGILTFLPSATVSSVEFNAGGSLKSLKL